MSFCCSQKSIKRYKSIKWNPDPTELQKLRKKYRFSENQLIEFRNRFENFANSNYLISRSAFRECMGILGLDGGFYLADRLFLLLDPDKDGFINLDDYLQYFDILLNGAEEEKQLLTFKLIDVGGKGYFTYDDYSQLIMNMLHSWNNLTGSHYNIQQNEKLQYFIKAVFDRFDGNKDSKIIFENFKKVIDLEPQLLDIFDYFNKGIAESIGPTPELDKVDQNVIDGLEELRDKVNKLKEFISNGFTENLESPKKEPKLTTRSTFDRRSLKAPTILNRLESNIKRSIFFEHLRDMESDVFATNHIQMNSRYHSVAILPSEPAPKIQRHNTQASKREEPILGNSEFLNTLDDRNGDNESVNKIANISNCNVDDKEANELDKFQTPHKLNEIIKARAERTNLSRFSYLKDDSVKKSVQIITIPNEVHIEDELLTFTKPSQNDELRLNMSQIDKDGRKELMIDIPKISSALYSPKNRDPETPDIRVNFDDRENSINENSLIPEKRDFMYNNNRVDSNSILKHKISNVGPLKFEDKNPGVRLDFSINEKSIVNSGRKMTFLDLKGQDISEKVLSSTIYLEKMDQKMASLIEEIKNKQKNTSKKEEPEPGNHERTTEITLHNIPKQKTLASGDAGISFGHPKWNLILNMIFGIRMAVNSNVDKGEFDPITSKDFGVKYGFELVPRRNLNIKTNYKVCKFFDYSPSVFCEIRKMFGVKNDDYLRSIGPETMLNKLFTGNLETLKELISSGKSGSFFYYSADGKFILKTVSKAEFHFLRNILREYFNHLTKNPNSLIMK